MPSLRKSPQFARWLGVALAIRIISAFTHSHWIHPDEYFQTMELGRILVQGIGSFSHEVGLHLRNLTWPLLLGIPIQLAQGLAPHSTGLAVHLTQLFSGLLDLAIVWGWWQLLQELEERSPLPDSERQFWRTISFGLLILPWFAVQDSIRTSSEHASTILIWVTLGMLARRRWFWAGFCAVGIAAMKYPCGLISAAFLISALVRRKPWRPLLLGTLAGLLVFGAADWAVYGRPWESLWMYLQYNLFTGQAAKDYGTQGLLTYIVLLKDHWGPLILPLAAAALLPLGIYGMKLALPRWEPWAFAICLYGIPHLLIGHKEFRFLLPLETLFLWSAYTGARALYPKLKKERTRVPAWLKSALLAAGIAVIAANGILLIRALWGETWRPVGTYFEIDRHLRENPDTCAVITIRFPVNSLLLPTYGDEFPSPVMGDLLITRDDSAFEKARHGYFWWLEHKPKCGANQSVLFHLFRPDASWTEQGCTLLDSGILHFLPKSGWDWALQKKLASGPWYRCPAKILDRFTEQTIHHELAHHFTPLQKLPPFGITGEELVELGKKNTPPLTP